MPLDRDKLIAKLDRMGEERVELALVRDEWSPEELGIVQGWRMDQERKTSRRAAKKKVRRAWTLGEKIAVAALVVTVIGVAIAFLAWRFPTQAQGSPITGISGSAVLPDQVSAGTHEDDAGQSVSSEDVRAKSLHSIWLETYPDIASFKFLDPTYEPVDGPGSSNWIPVYQATRSAFYQIDKILCSYPDASHIESDFDKRLIFTVCAFSEGVRPELQVEGGPAHSYLQFRIYFFDSDIRVVENLSCECSNISFRDARVDRMKRTVSFAVQTDSIVLEVEGAKKKRIILDGLPLKNQDRDYTRLSFSFDDKWIFQDFRYD